jgi:hypothetical protein
MLLTTTESLPRRWLLRSKLTQGTKEFEAAKKYIAEGNSIDTVKLKYEISSDVEKLLLS